MTILVYLNDNFKGGETSFPMLDKKIKPEKGKAVIFYNTDTNGTILRKSKHAGIPVIEGEKWICNKWIHLNKY
jgi:prolyl 4-hydroxylase